MGQQWHISRLGIPPASPCGGQFLLLRLLLCSSCPQPVTAMSSMFLPHTSFRIGGGLETVHFRQANVEQYHMGPIAFCRFYGLLAVVSHVDCIPMISSKIAKLEAASRLAAIASHLPVLLPCAQLRAAQGCYSVHAVAPPLGAFSLNSVSRMRLASSTSRLLRCSSAKTATFERRIPG